MTKKDVQLLEEAYLSVSKKIKGFPSDTASKVSTDPNNVVSAGPMEEPAPGIDMEMVEPEETPSTSAPVKISVIPSSLEDDVEDEEYYDDEEEECCCGSGSCSCGEEEDEAVDMAIDNLNSIRESIMKIATYCSCGKPLEVWAQQKLAIAMDNLAGIARSLR